MKKHKIYSFLDKNENYIIQEQHMLNEQKKT